MELLKPYKLYIYIALAVAALSVLGAIYYHIYQSGAAGAEAAQAKAQIKHTRKVEKGFNEVLRKAPANNDDVGVAERLLKRTVR